jgi:hypothetical protein
MSASFFLCSDPLSTFNNGVSHFIFNSEKPRFFAVVQPLDRVSHPQDYNGDGLNLLFRYVRGDGHEQMYLLLVLDNIDKSTSPVIELLQQAAGYYVSILAEQDEQQYNKKSIWTLLPDYNKDTNRVKLLHIKQAKKYLLAYTGGVRTFSSEEQVKQFIQSGLNYPKDKLISSTETVW